MICTDKVPVNLIRRRLVAKFGIEFLTPAQFVQGCDEERDLRRRQQRRARVGARVFVRPPDPARAVRHPAAVKKPLARAAAAAAAAAAAVTVATATAENLH